MKTLQIALVFVVAFSLGVYLARPSTQALPMPAPTFVAPTPTPLTIPIQGCKTDLLVVFPFQVSQVQLAEIMNVLYAHYLDWSIERDGATMLRVIFHVPNPNALDEVKLESQAVGGKPALCLTPALRKEIEALAADTLQGSNGP